MAKLTIYKQQVWTYLNDTIEYLLKIKEEDISDKVSIGINYSIILNTACVVEGFTEAKLKEILKFKRTILNQIDVKDFDKRIHYNMFIHSICDDLESRISKCTGVDKYNFLFKLLTDKHLNFDEAIKEIWEGINVLFQFRNVIAHGREVSATKFESYFIEESTIQDFKGGYRKLEEYLKKKGLINDGFMETESATNYFKRNIAEHFWEIANIYMQQLDKVVKEKITNKEYYSNEFDTALANSENIEEALRKFKNS